MFFGSQDIDWLLVMVGLLILCSKSVCVFRCVSSWVINYVLSVPCIRCFLNIDLKLRFPVMLKPDVF